MNYCPNTEKETSEMLKVTGVKSIEDLFSSIPEKIRTKSFNIPEGKTELEVLDYFKKLSQKNDTGPVSFLGGGVYDHFIPAAVDFLSGRAEFYTAYTPYQPECSQGTLQALFEFQTAMCRLTGLDVSNASLYDGATALAEAALMAVRITQRNRLLIGGGVSLFYRQVLKTYLLNHSIELIELKTDRDNPEKPLISNINDQTAAVIVQNPDFFGSIGDYTDAAEKAHSAGALLIMSVYPVPLGLIKTPAEMGVDIAVGDGQSLGMPVSFGGPSFGFITVKKDYVRNLPGRIVGETVDRNGKRGFVLTLQAREQHIKRQRATSNICSNQSLCALRAVIYLSLLGRHGFQELANLNYNKAEYLKKSLSGIKKISIWNKSPTFNEFVIELPLPASKIAAGMNKKGFYAGLPLGGFYPELDKMLLIAVTEKRTREEMDDYVKALGELL